MRVEPIPGDMRPRGEGPDARKATETGRRNGATVLPWTVRDLQIVGMSEMAVSTNAGNVLVTYSLGSCVALSLYDPSAEVGGLIHCKLPVSTLDREQARNNPQVFVDTGVSSLLQAVYDLGARSRTLVAKVAGAAQRVDENGRFATGRRNYTVLRKLLWKNNILIAAEDIGGSRSRSVFLEISSGQTYVRSQGKLVAL